MLLHLIEIILLLAILVNQGVEIHGPQDWIQSLVLVILAVAVVAIDRWWYQTDIDYDKIREIIRQEIEKEKSKNAKA